MENAYFSRNASCETYKNNVCFKIAKNALGFMYNSGQRLKLSDLNFNLRMRSNAREQNILENVAPKSTSEIYK